MPLPAALLPLKIFATLWAPVPGDISSLLHMAGAEPNPNLGGVGVAPGPEALDARRPFKCQSPGCGYAATQRVHLTLHERTHTGERPYKCDVLGCGYAATQRGHLLAHSRTHTGEKPYTCSFPGCAYSAARRHVRDAHERTHTGVSPFPCFWVGCGFGGRDRPALKAHLSRAHGCDG